LLLSPGEKILKTSSAIAKQVCRLAAGAALVFVCSAAQAQIRIGVSAALTGSAALNGQSLANGASLAEEEINAAGGVGGKKIELVIVDDKSSPPESQAVFDRLINKDKVLFIIGPTTTPQATQAWVFATSQKVVAIGTSISTSGMTKASPFLFRVTATEDLMTPASVKSAASVYKSKTVGALFQDDDNFAYGAYMGALRGFAREGMNVVAREVITEKDKDFEPKLARIRDAKPDILYVSTRANDAADIIIMARKMGMKMPIVGNNNFVAKTIYDKAKEAAENVVFTLSWSASSEDPKNVAFMAAYNKKFKGEPNSFAALAYDAVYVAAEAAKKIKLTSDLGADRIAFRDALEAVTYSGAAGKVRFKRVQGGYGFDAERDVFTHIYRNGKLELQKVGFWGQWF
jgi:branched-chain amino acid transport system substrate-binding protein